MLDFRYPIELVTLSDVKKFNSIVNSLPCKILLTDGDGYCLNAKSLLGNIAALEWTSLYCESDEDIYSYIYKFYKFSK